MKSIFRIFALIALIFCSCDRIKDDPENIFPDGRGLFLLNEGNYLAGNGSLSFYSFESNNIFNDLFKRKNQRPLGDIPSFLAADGSRGYIIVNNSGTIEVININTLESLGTITGLNSPRQMVIHNGKGYVSSLFSNVITLIDLDDLSITGTIDIGCSSEALVISGSRLFAAHWSGGSKIVVINIADDTVETTITTGMEPESMVLDKNSKLWVLCTGGYMNEEVPRIIMINTSTMEIEKEMWFRTNSDNPSSLTINTGRDSIYYIDEGVRRLTLTSSSLPSDVIIPSEGRLFYKLAAAPWNGLLCVTDAIDYQQKGDLLLFDRNGQLVDSQQAGIIPGFIRFTE